MHGRAEREGGAVVARIGVHSAAFADDGICLFDCFDGREVGEEAGFRDDEFVLDGGREQEHCLARFGHGLENLVHGTIVSRCSKYASGGPYP